MNKENNQTPEQYYSSNEWREKVRRAIDECMTRELAEQERK